MATSLIKKFTFMAIGSIVGGLTEAGLSYVDDKSTRKKLGLPSDATDAEVRNLLRDNKMKVDGLSPEAQAILDSVMK